jgi:Flp pilus assembly protein TadB
MRLFVTVALGAGIGATSLLSGLPFVGTHSRSWVLRPHIGPAAASDRSTAASRWAGGETILAVGTAASRLTGRALGIVEPLAVRLDRINHRDDASSFRFRQGSAAVTAAVLGAALSLLAAVTPALILVLTVGVTAAAVLAPEAELIWQGRRWSAATRYELPVVGEQLVALLQAGRSPTTALEEVADSSGTPLRRDLARVVDHLRRGGGLDEALARWASRSDVDAVHRLTGVLSLHHRTPDLAELLRAEVDAARDELHRDLLALIDRRGQQVWIPVTVAALIPGAIFLLVPFFDALRLFGATS